MKKLTAVSATAPSKEAITVLALGQPAEDRTALRGIFSHSNWKLYEAVTRQTGLELVRRHGIGVVICEAELPDGTWKAVLEELQDTATPPRLIVSSRLADQQLWGAVLNVGAYDLLATPFEPSEVRRAVVSAWHAAKHDVQPAARVHTWTGDMNATAAQA